MHFAPALGAAKERSVLIREIRGEWTDLGHTQRGSRVTGAKWSISLQ